MTISNTTSKTTSTNAATAGLNSNVQTVKKGDTLAKIANQNNLSLDAILEQNPQISDANLIKPGQEIKLPTGDRIPPTGTGKIEDEEPFGTRTSGSTATPDSAANARAANIASGALRRNLLPNFQPDNLEQVRAGSARLIKGSRGPAVESLQNLLNKNGANLDKDGIFGPKTEAALIHFQKTRGLSDSGIAGPKTLTQLDAGAPATQAPIAPSNTTPSSATSSANGVLPNTSDMTQAQKFDHYSNMIEQNGGRVNNEPNQRNIAALRVETDADINGGKGAYDDRMVMLWQDDNGTKHVREYNANTEPSAQYRGRYGEDANRDGSIDQGRLPAGHYEYEIGRSSTLGNVMRPTENVNAERDTNHDGLFNDGAYASAGKSMLIHSGGSSNTASAGCQTMSPSEYGRFWADMNASGNPGKVGYTVIHVD
jgi:peptidoglycan hydrolase-like protein with peptidoglycan-binding domain